MDDGGRVGGCGWRGWRDVRWEMGSWGGFGWGVRGYAIAYGIYRSLKFASVYNCWLVARYGARSLLSLGKNKNG